MNPPAPTGSSDEIILSRFGPTLPPPSFRADSSYSLPLGGTPEEKLRSALIQAYGDDIPTWQEVILVASSLGSF